MKKMFSIMTLLLSIFTFALSASESITGFWRSVDERTKKTESILAIYEYHGQFFGRLIVTFNDDGTVNDTIYDPKSRAPGVVGDPYYAGMDIIWNLKDNGKKFTGGSIMDPEKGNVYGAELWRQGNDLIVRGELLIFGRNQIWPPALDSDFPPGFKKPDLTTMIPVIPKVK